MTALCLKCNQIIDSRPVPLGAPIPALVAEDRRESFRAFAGLYAAVDRHFGLAHQQDAQMMGIQVSVVMAKVMSIFLMREVDSTDTEFAVWMATMRAELEQVLQDLLAQPSSPTDPT